MKAIPEMHRAHEIWYLRFNYHHWVVTSACGLFIHDDIIHPVVSVSSLTWFIKYIYSW